MASNGASGTARVAIVTGAAFGMGTALSKHFVSKGWRVALLDIDDEAGKKLADSLGPNAAFWYANVASYDSQAKAFAGVWGRWGRIDGLLANAGITDRSSMYILKCRNNSVSEIPPEPNLLCTDIDYKGVLYGIQLATHFMRHNNPPGGKIVCTSSNAGIHPHRSYPEYNGAKAGVINYVRTVAPVLLDKENIYINCVCPGIVATNIIPPEMVAAVSQDCMTPVDTIVRAYDEFLADKDQRSGEIMECSADKVSSLNPERLEFRNGKPSIRSVTVWDPLFKTLHGENSGLVEAIP